MNSLPMELIILIMKQCDLRTRTQFLVVNKDFHVEAKRILKPKIQVKGEKTKEITTDGHIRIEVSFKNGWKKIKYFKGHVLHRENGAAWIAISRSGIPFEEKWFRMGKLHRDGHPARKRWFLDGMPAIEVWAKNGCLHREESGEGSGAAETCWFVNGEKEEEIWYKNGKLHRENGPAYIKWFFSSFHNCIKQQEIWLKDGCKHREEKDGPAELEWFMNGQIKAKRWFRNGKLYRKNNRPTEKEWNSDGVLCHVAHLI